MPESEEKEELANVWAAIGAAIAIVVIIALVVLIPGLYVKLWEWVY